jgi:two-component system nitrogen regulation response regulator NtrX
MNETVLIVDDEADIRNLIKGILEDEGYRPRQAGSAKQAYEEMDRALPDLVILDIWLHGSDHDGLQILANIKKRHPHLPVVMISGHGTIETAVTSIKQGAYDFIEKPFKSDRLLMMARRAIENASLKQENEALKKKVAKPPKMVGQSPAAQNLRQILERVAPTNSRILLTGEPGSGKDIAARMIHDLSARASRPFLVINCATLRPERLETELFGSDEPGNETPGVIEQADKGTVFLDEVSDMPLETQGKIMRVLQEQRFIRMGGQREIEVDVRIIASTNQNLEKSITEGKFRQDLFYRLNVVPVLVPPLRERIQDISLLLEYFVQQISEQSGLPPRAFSSQALGAMQTYPWPGNIRQLKNVVEWAMIMSTARPPSNFSISDLPPEITGQGYADDSEGSKQNSNFMMLPLREAREIFEREYLQSQITRFGGNISKTAQFIGMERSALHRKLKSLQILNGEKDEEPLADNVTLIQQKRA